jgi:hypothetical protein
MYCLRMWIMHSQLSISMDAAFMDSTMNQKYLKKELDLSWTQIDIFDIFLSSFPKYHHTKTIYIALECSSQQW